ncbi:SET domain-containing protein [Lojkania enalia]|uniref:SET domain-containing protein n=1 Tax=Lojkania enalia TaxID=147567 RepID=A0A9P4KE85_9PLEO|nr:SET domain-containing protein [Didymosphaeria enalia]
MPAMVVVGKSRQSDRQVLADKVHSILCNRVRRGEEEYLVRWKTDTTTKKPPFSWHSLSELSRVRCLEFVQDYLEVRATWSKNDLSLSLLSKKRKSPDSEIEYERRPSPLDRRLLQSSRTPSTERSPSVGSNTLSTNNSSSLPTQTEVYNGILDIEDGLIFARSASGPDVPELSIMNVPTPEMIHAARRSKTDRAEAAIRFAYTRFRLAKVPGKPIKLINTVDSSTPSLRFRYIPDYVLGQGVFKVDPAAQVGCKQCSPHMGRDIGCEYTKKCDCLEYAVVDESRLTDEQRELYETAKATGSSTIGLPKKFPYFAEGTKIRRAGCLVPFYRDSRHPIYECNNNCNCGPYCRNKNVQFGRMVELEIFKTASDRGWGLRCPEKLYEGQFIDTYRGEIITDAEATRREEAATSKAKASYLYSLDKFAESEGMAPEEVYVVDGEFMGGPTRFMNHSCDPNCRQYTVSYNKHDCKVYDIAFFACKDIEAGEELTFDYMDNEDEGGSDEEVGEDAIPCLCGAPNCRKWLWT